MQMQNNDGSQGYAPTLAESIVATPGTASPVPRVGLDAMAVDQRADYSQPLMVRASFAPGILDTVKNHPAVAGMALAGALALVAIILKRR